MLFVVNNIAFKMYQCIQLRVFVLKYTSGKYTEICYISRTFCILYVQHFKYVLDKIF